MKLRMLSLALCACAACESDEPAMDGTSEAEGGNQVAGGDANGDGADRAEAPTPAPDAGTEGEAVTRPVEGAAGEQAPPEEPAPPPPYDLDNICDEPAGTMGSCLSGASGTCQEAVTGFGTAGIAICIPDFGDRPSDDPCPLYGATGRCFDVGGEYWVYYYDGTEAERVSRCDQREGIYCAALPGLSEALIETCRTGCAAAEPDHTGAPECAMLAEECLPMCQETVAGLSMECAQCLIDNLFWEQGGCGETECFCTLPEFPTVDTPLCADACQ